MIGEIGAGIMYTFESRIRYSECDSEEKLTIESVMNYFQDCSTFHSEDLGVGTGYLKKEHRAWVLNNWQIVFDKMPCLGDKVIIGTFPYDMRGFLGYRNFMLCAPEGTRYAYAHTLWSYIDTDTMHPVKVPEDIVELYGKEPKLEMDYAPRKLAMPENGERKKSIVVEPFHLDSNHHVNNVQYIRMALQYMPKDCIIRELRAEYKKQAVLGDILYPVVTMEEQVLYVALCDEEGSVYVNIQLFLNKNGD